jgi:hypothetical protein
LAEYPNVIHQANSKLERGVSLPDTGIFLELSQLLSVTVESILMGGYERRRTDRDKFPISKASVSFIDGSEEAVGYRVKIMHKPAFQIVGFTRIIPPHDETKMIEHFVSEVIANGKIYLLRQTFDRCDWMCFEVPQDRFDDGHFWKDNPYKMLKTLSYRFHIRVGVHFDAIPPDHDEMTNPGVEFWISVIKETADCEVCRSRPQCANIQPFV